MSFEHVSFAYDGVTAVLKVINLCCRPGTITALVGRHAQVNPRSYHLVGAFYNPTSGRIRVDGYDVSTLQLDSYRSQLGLVLQETFLSDGSIRENVIFSPPEATDAEITNALAAG